MKRLKLLMVTAASLVLVSGCGTSRFETSWSACGLADDEETYTLDSDGTSFTAGPVFLDDPGLNCLLKKIDSTAVLDEVRAMPAATFASFATLGAFDFSWSRTNAEPGAIRIQVAEHG